MNGNGGSDQIILQANGTDDQAAAFGGFGNDTINAFGQGGTVDGGEAKDRFELLFGGLEFDSDSPDQGVVTTITDFVPGEDVLVLPLEIDTAGSAAIHLSLSKSFKLMTTVILIPFFQLYTLQRHQQKLQSHRQQQYVCCAPPI